MKAISLHWFLQGPVQRYQFFSSAIHAETKQQYMQKRNREEGKGGELAVGTRQQVRIGRPGDHGPWLCIVTSSIDAGAERSGHRSSEAPPYPTLLYPKSAAPNATTIGIIPCAKRVGLLRPPPSVGTSPSRRRPAADRPAAEAAAASSALCPPVVVRSVGPSSR